MSLYDDEESPMFICKPRSCNIVWVKYNPRVRRLLNEKRKEFAQQFKSLHGRYPGINDDELLHFLDREEKRIRRRLGDRESALKLAEKKRQRTLF